MWPVRWRLSTIWVQVQAPVPGHQAAVRPREGAVPGAGAERVAPGDAVCALEPLDGTAHPAGRVGRRVPECAPVSTHTGQEGLRGAGSGAKTGLEEPHGQRFPVTCLARDANRALCSPSLGRSMPGSVREASRRPHRGLQKVGGPCQEPVRGGWNHLAMGHRPNSSDPWATVPDETDRDDVHNTKDSASSSASLNESVAYPRFSSGINISCIDDRSC